MIGALRVVACVAWLCASAASAAPVADARRFEASPVLDGLVDGAWAAIAATEGFVERKPAQGGEPPVATRFRAGYDAEALWLLVECDDAPGGVTARIRARDSFEMFSDDAISAKIDAHTDRRTTLGFATNPLGARLDYRATQDGAFELEVDPVWAVAVARRDDGWTAELRIPWPSLGLDPAALPPSLGLNWSRDHARRNATYDWALMAPPYSPMSASLFGTLRLVDALPVAETHVDLAVTPFVTAGLRDTDGFANAGADARLTLGATQLSLTANTDFAQADVDDQVVQLDRFGLFIPEKRDFFLAHAPHYDVGRSGVFQPLYTRRIGLSAADDPSLLGGVALSAQVDAPTVTLRTAALQATTRPTGGAPWTSSLVARAELVGRGEAQWSAGLIGTWRRGEAADDSNAVFGLDAAYRGPAPWVVRAALLGSVTGDGAPSPGIAVGGEGVGGLAVAPALHVRAVGRDPLVQPTVDYRYVHRDFRADLGFVDRADVHALALGLNVEPRIQRWTLEKATITASGDVVASGAADALLDWSARLDAALTWDAGWWLALGAGYGSLRVDAPFPVGPRLIGAGVYEGANASITASSPSTWALYGSLTADGKAWFGGQLLGGSGSLTWKPVDRFRLEASCDAHRALFDDGADFTTVLVNGRIALGLTTELSLDLFTGFALLDDALRAQVRLRYGWLPGSDLFVVYGVDATTGDAAAVGPQTLLVKLALRVDTW